MLLCLNYRCCSSFLPHKQLSSFPPQILVDQNVKASPHVPRWDLLEPISWIAFDSPCQPGRPSRHTARNCACHWRWRFGPPGRILEDKPGKQRHARHTNPHLQRMDLGWSQWHRLWKEMASDVFKVRKQPQKGYKNNGTHGNVGLVS